MLMKSYQKLLVLALVAATLFTLAAPATQAYSYYYRAPDYGYASPIYAHGYYYGAYTYGWSGWDYNRVYYKYHYPYATYRYGGYYPGYFSAPGSIRYYYPRGVAFTGYPWPGWYW